MGKQKYKPYGIDVDYEFSTYRYIGRDYGDRKTANKGITKNLCRFWRKKIYNINSRKYAFCNTHSEWKKHVTEILPPKKIAIMMTYYIG